MTNIKIFKGKNENVKKYVFTKEDAVYEAVVYKYGSYLERTVTCCSVQSSCPVGCVFCGTGKRFVRNLKTDEITNQITEVLTHEEIVGKRDLFRHFTTAGFCLERHFFTRHFSFLRFCRFFLGGRTF